MAIGGHSPALRHPLLARIDVYWAELMQVLDVAIVTYYAVDKSFQVLKPTQYGGEFPSKLLAAAELSKNKPIVVQEVGMPSHPDLGGSDGLQADFADFVLREWDKLGNRIAFLSWWQLYDYLYDPNLVVTHQGDATSPLIIQSSTYPKEITPDGNPTGLSFIPQGNRLPSFFYGPKRPNAPPTEQTQNDADTAYFVQQSVGPLAPFCKYLSTCGLLRPDGSLKESSLVWKNWTAARRVQS